VDGQQQKMKEKDESVKLKDHMLDTSVCLVKGGSKMEMAPWKRENNSELGGCTEVEINGAAGAGKITRIVGRKDGRVRRTPCLNALQKTI